MVLWCAGNWMRCEPLNALIPSTQSVLLQLTNKEPSNFSVRGEGELMCSAKKCFHYKGMPSNHLSCTPYRGDDDKW